MAAADVKVWVRDTKDYFNDLKLEMRRVTWPNRKQVEGTTTVVILSVFAFAAYNCRDPQRVRLRRIFCGGRFDSDEGRQSGPGVLHKI